MKPGLFIALGLLGVWLAAWAIASTISEPLVLPRDADKLLPRKIQSVAIAPRSDALTFARFARDGQTHVVLVTGYAAGNVSGIDLTSMFPDTPGDPITMFNTRGYEALEVLSGSEVLIPANALLVPFDGAAVQIAMGVNYPDHGEEVAVTQQFVFPKLTAASRPTATVAARDYLLDYEIELGFVLLQPLSRDSFPQTMGLVLASDYTDRAALLRSINLFDVSSGDGFSQAKSKAGFMPIGNLLVIPKDLGAY